jgi:Raf kinase inhibitor-like YbhB/YbcL family protein
MQLTSTAFTEGQPIPARYTADGENVSPPLRWDAPPDATRGLALVCEDPDAPRGTWTHWVVFNLPPNCRELAEGAGRNGGVPDGAVEGLNDFGRLGYGGPSPPPGKPHRYFFKLYALDAPLDLQSGLSRPELLAAMKGHVLDQAILVGKYGRLERDGGRAARR